MITLKNQKQIDGIRKSCHTLATLFSEVGPEIKEGMSTYDIDALFFSWIKKKNVVAACLGYNGYPAATCISVNDTLIHGIPSKKEIIKEGDLVSVDICINQDGYISDAARSYEIGKVEERVHRLNKVTEECLYLGIEAAGKKNARVQDIAKAVESHAKKYNYGVCRDFCGHGVGLDIHEDPYIPNYVSPLNSNPRLRSGMIISIEPMINEGSYKVKIQEDGWTVKTVDGKLACHWEHTVLINDNGIEILTKE